MAWVYDAQGRVTSKTQSIGTNARIVGYGYTNGLLTTQTNPSGFVLTYAYTNGRVTNISINGTTILNNVLYDPFGPARQWTWGNGAITVRTYDTDGKITQTDSGGFKTYGYDNAFRITSITDTVTPANSWSTLAYDNLDRLTSADKTGTTIGYTFDANGNRLTQTGTTAATYTMAGTNNRLSSVSGGLTRSYTYNTAGSALTTGATIHTYYNSGRMKTGRLTSTGTNTTYLHNALGQRIRKTGGTPGTVVFVYDESGHLVGEYGSTGTLVQETIWLGDIPVATIRPNGASFDIFYVHTDHLNQPRKVTNNAAVPVVRWTFEPNPFGDGTPNENPAAAGVFKFHLRFPGQYFDIESNLAYNYFRDYDSAIGRYVESDPIGLSGGINTYGYVNQRPTMLVDPSGLCSCRGGSWTQDFGDFTMSAAFGGYISVGRVNYTCRTNPKVKCTASVVCIGGGPIVGGGFVWNLGGVVYGAPRSTDLQGWSGWQVTGSVGPVVGQAPTLSSGSGGSVAGGLSFGAGLAGIKCRTNTVRCECDDCEK